MSLFRRQLPQNILQYPAVFEVLDLLRRVDADIGGELLHGAFGGCSFHRERLALSKPARQKRCEPSKVIDLFAIESKRLRALPSFELQR